jgi:hypothetical protein
MTKYAHQIWKDGDSSAQGVGRKVATMLDCGVKQVSVNSALEGDEGQQIRQSVDVDEDIERSLDDNAAATEEYDEVEEEEAAEKAAKANEG